MQQITLQKLVSHFPETFKGQQPEVAVSGIALDSRHVKPGYVFVALAGESADGHRFIPAAVDQGAAAVVGTETRFDIGVPYLRVPDGRQALAQL